MWAGVFLAVWVLAVYGQVLNHDFVDYDDDEYVTQNPPVQAGWSWESVKWAFTTTLSYQWHPLTWLSHMLDWQIYGAAPGLHHLTNLLLHAANTLLLFMLFNRMSGALWKSLFVSALFAVHPLHVENVAWVSDRKDLLCTFFWMLTTWAYLSYVKSPGSLRYGIVSLLYVLGLLSKAMIVTLPFVLLLLDYWPLRRLWGDPFDRGGVSDGRMPRAGGFFSRIRWGPIVEKIPWLAAGMALALFMAFAVRGEHAGLFIRGMPGIEEVWNALITYAVLLGKTLWPQRLSISYVFPAGPPLWSIAVSAALFLSVSLLVVRFGRRYPYLPVGWLWFLITLLPIVGMTEGVSHRLADRYAYVPAIGLFVMLTWGAAELLSGRRYGKPALAVAGGSLLVVLSVSTWVQVGHWKNSVTLFRHTLSLNPTDFLAHNNLGLALMRERKVKEAIWHFNRAVEIRPRLDKAYENLGNAMMVEGLPGEAVMAYRKALGNNPKNPGAVLFKLGKAYVAQGALTEGITCFREALRAGSPIPATRVQLGRALGAQGRFPEAEESYRQALSVSPGSAELHNGLADLYAARRMFGEAVEARKKALRIEPRDGTAHYRIAVEYFFQKDYAKAIEHCDRALALGYTEMEPLFLRSLDPFRGAAREKREEGNPPAS